ncbi:hypothetical protein M011DRAFT_458211 [Sporormia fimetaria CBS 119925]|uniref:Rhodopsin domain-containing protein n=1 Tax=Sporormia fimetaria CBS 119925 TaxID=1340428 RepID=A0A6A6VB71_9PLEO|nr:hypothetical protein M011DRAFT_458211 [Sporormia fimetaria CBS 119925]
MAEDLKHAPIAAITDSDHGAWNTIACCFLIVTSILATVLRVWVTLQRRNQLGLDDALFGLALILAIVMSIISQQMVHAGLGQHQDTLSSKDVDTFYKFHYASQILALLSMYCSKASVIFLFHRIIPAPGPRGLKVLAPFIATCGVVSICLVAFQCQLPKPWILEPFSCSTRGRVHYVNTGLNIVTDTLLAVWLVPTIRGLQTTKSRKLIVSVLLLARFLVCMCDGGKIFFVSRALQSEDSTWSFLDWAIMEQVVVHLSLNHATLPRINSFLRTLHTGAAASTIRAGTSHTRGYGQVSRPINISEPRKSPLQALRNTSVSSSQEHLHLPQATEMSTMVIAGDDKSTSSAGKGFPHDQIKIEQTVEISRR